MASYDKDADWRSQLDSKYSESAEFQEVFSQYTGEGQTVEPLLQYHGNYDQTPDPHAPLHKLYPAIRFPPIAKVPLPAALDPSKFLKDLSVELEQISRKSVKYDDTIAGINFLEAMFKTLFEKTAGIRESIIENGVYLYSLVKPIEEADSKNINSIVMENLALMRDDSTQLLDEVGIFSREKMDEVLVLEHEADKLSLLQGLKASLIDRGQLLKHEIASNLLSLDQLTEYAHSFVHYPPHPYLDIDGVAVNFERENQFYSSHVQLSLHNLEYMAFMGSRGFPICPRMHAYLLSGEACGQRLWMEGYEFKGGEFSLLLSYLHRQRHRSLRTHYTKHIVAHTIKELNLSHCKLADADMHALGKHLSLFPSLLSLRLSHNLISFSGIVSLATHIFEHGSALHALYLDHNRVNKEGAGLVGQILSRMPDLQILDISHNLIKDTGLYTILRHLLNTKRKAYQTMPRLDSAKSLSLTARRYSRSLSVASRAEGGREEEEKRLTSPYSEGTEILDEEEEEEEVKSRKSAKGKERYPGQSFLQDYFLSHFSVQSQTKAKLYMASQTAAAYQWVNEDDEEFEMDGDSVYSVEQEEEEERNSASLDSRSVHSKYNYQLLLQEREKLTLAQKSSGKEELPYYAEYPKLVQRVCRLRLKLAAIGMFSALRERGHKSLSHLYVAHCYLTPAILPALQHVISDNHYITSLDMSENRSLLTKLKDTLVVNKMISSSALRHFYMNDVGLTDAGLMELAKTLPQSNIKLIEMSHNSIGPTGANVIANIAKDFHIDVLSIRNAQKMKTVNLEGDSDEDSETESKRHSIVEKASEGIDFDEDASYVDTDLFDGEESDDFPEEEGEEEQIERRKSTSIFAKVARVSWKPKKSIQ